MDWIENLKPVFKEVSLESGIPHSHDTHYDARNFVFSKVKGSEIHRLEFQPLESGSFQITKLIDRYPALPRVFRLLHNIVPFFPYIAKTNFENVGVLNPPFESAVFKNTIKETIENAL